VNSKLNCGLAQTSSFLPRYLHLGRHMAVCFPATRSMLRHCLPVAREKGSTNVPSCAAGRAYRQGSFVLSITVQRARTPQRRFRYTRLPKSPHLKDGKTNEPCQTVNHPDIRWLRSVTKEEVALIRVKPSLKKVYRSGALGVCITFTGGSSFHVSAR